jgi:hypothetical protein
VLTYIYLVAKKSKSNSSAGTETRDPNAVALGRKGGLVGGPARASKLTPEQRSESARKAVQARWAKYKKTKKLASTSLPDTPEEKKE